MNKKLCLAVALALLSVAAAAQQPKEQTAGGDEGVAGGFVKQIEIQKEYSATITTADRIEREPRLLDTTVVRPKMNYTILSSAEKTSFGVSPLSPITFSTARWSNPKGLYVSAGAGAPLQSEVDVYYTPISNRRSELQLYLNHQGSMDRRTNVRDAQGSALLLRNRAGVLYNTSFKGGTALAAELNYRGNIANPYGGLAGGDVARKTIATNDLELRAKLTGRLGGRKSPLSYEANAVVLGALGSNYGATDATAKVGRYSVNFGVVGLDGLKGWAPERVTLHFFGVGGYCPTHEYHDSSVTIIPEWSLRVGEHLPVKIILGYDHVVVPNAKQSLNGIMTVLEASYTKWNNGVVPYAKVSNDFDTGLLREYMWLNPYGTMLPSDSRKLYRAEVGAKGSVARRVDYRVAVGRVHYSRYMFQTVMEGDPYLHYPDVEVPQNWLGKGLGHLYAEAEGRYVPMPNLVVEGAVKASFAERTQVDLQSGIRPLEARVAARYQPLARLQVAIEGRYGYATAVSVTDNQNNEIGTIELPHEVNVGASVEYKATEQLVVWLRGDNLLGRELYLLPTYKAMGANFRMGVRMAF